MTVRQLLETIDSRELTEWQIYESETGPLGGERLDINAAMIAQAIVNTQIDPKKSKPFPLEKFMIKWNDGGRSRGDDS